MILRLRSDPALGHSSGAIVKYNNVVIDGMACVRPSDEYFSDVSIPVEWLEHSTILDDVIETELGYATVWYISGTYMCHRVDGPAWMANNGTNLWYVDDDECLTADEYQVATGISDEDMIALILMFGPINQGG